MQLNPLNSKSNPICHLLALLVAHHILHVSKVKVNIILPFTPEFPLGPLHMRNSLTKNRG
jgi:hypothetical protein